MTTLRTPPVSKLGIDMQAFRTDRPDEWRMDEFTKQAESMALRIKELEAALTKIKDITGELGGQNPANFCEELAMEQDDATYRVYKLSNGALSKALEQNK